MTKQPKSHRKIVSWEIPMRTVSEANSTEYWTKKKKRHDIQKSTIHYYFLKEQPETSLPCHIILTRFAPRSLDQHDNLPMSFKWIVDSICANLIPDKKAGVADNDPRITIEYKQEKSKLYRIGIEIFCD